MPSKVDITPSKILRDRVIEINDMKDINSTFFPSSITIEDLDKGFFEFINDSAVNLSIDGKKVPVIYLANERWAEFEKTWSFSDENEQPIMPFITLRRPDSPKPGTSDITKYNIPQGRKFTYTKVPTFNNNVEGIDIYRIPQPVAVDLIFELSIFTHYLIDLNSLAEKILTVFSARQAYQIIKGHYIPIVLNTISDESSLEGVDDQRFYLQKYTLMLKGYIIDEDDFEILKGNRRIILTKKII